MEFKESAGTSPCPAHAALLDSRARATGRFSDIPGGVASYTAIPQLGWFQLVFLFAVLDQQIFPQDPNKAPGDVAGDNWVRYADDETRTPGLQEGRALVGVHRTAESFPARRNTPPARHKDAHHFVTIARGRFENIRAISRRVRRLGPLESSRHVGTRSGLVGTLLDAAEVRSS